jgi:hypothetical protein
LHAEEDSISRYSDLHGLTLVTRTAFVYDFADRLASLTHSRVDQGQDRRQEQGADRRHGSSPHGHPIFPSVGLATVHPAQSSRLFLRRGYLGRRDGLFLAYSNRV